MVSLQHDVANQSRPERAQKTPERDLRRAGGGTCTSCGCQQDLGRNLQKEEQPPKVACREGPCPGNTLPGQARARAGPSGPARAPLVTCERSRRCFPKPWPKAYSALV